jgi:putative ABC transport system permease protein
MSLEQPVSPEMNFPMAQMAHFLRRFNLIVRAKAEPLDLVPAVRAEVLKLDSQLPLYNVTTMQGAVDQTLSVRRFALWLLGIFAAVALLLALSGIYGVLAHSVAQRTHEIGVRMALGAARGDVLRLVFAQGGRMAAAGIGFGLLASYLMTQFLRTLLYGVKPADPLTFVAVALLLIVTVLLACWIPARRASRVDPMIALRSE